jgi:hypothetical protein
MLRGEAHNPQAISQRYTFGENEETVDVLLAYAS